MERAVVSRWGLCLGGDRDLLITHLFSFTHPHRINGDAAYTIIKELLPGMVRLWNVVADWVGRRGGMTNGERKRRFCAALLSFTLHSSSTELQSLTLTVKKTPLTPLPPQQPPGVPQEGLCAADLLPHHQDAPQRPLPLLSGKAEDQRAGDGAAGARRTATRMFLGGGEGVWVIAVLVFWKSACQLISSHFQSNQPPSNRPDTLHFHSNQTPSNQPDALQTTTPDPISSPGGAGRVWDGRGRPGAHPRRRHHARLCLLLHPPRRRRRNPKKPAFVGTRSRDLVVRGTERGDRGRVGGAGHGEGLAPGGHALPRACAARGTGPRPHTVDQVAGRPAGRPAAGDAQGDGGGVQRAEGEGGG